MLCESAAKNPFFLIIRLEKHIHEQNILFILGRWGIGIQLGKIDLQSIISIPHPLAIRYPYLDFSDITRVNDSFQDSSLKDRCVVSKSRPTILLNQNVLSETNPRLKSFVFHKC